MPGPPGATTVLLYAHHDVQPEGPHERWTSPPFEPEVRDGRLYGRGSSDDKAGIVVHAAAMRAFGAEPPVTVKVLVEGEEEAGTEHLPFLIEGHRELFAADVLCIADGGNWRTGVPALETSIRGVVDVTVTVRTGDLAVHSGVYGGAAPDALSGLAHVLASLHDEQGEVRIPGLLRLPWDGVEVDEAEFRRDARLRPGVRLLGHGTIAERLWSAPAVSVLGIDAPGVREASNQLVPAARAKISLRIAPGEDPERALDLLTEHVRSHAPWGVEVEVARGEGGWGLRVRADGPAFAAMDRAMALAYGREPVRSGSGGSVPTPDGDPDSNASQGGSGVLRVEDWAEIRRLHRAEQMPIKAIARLLGVSKDTVKAALASDGPPRYKRAPRGSIVDAVEPRIHELLRQWPDMPATVIAERIGWTRSMTVLKDRVRELRPVYLPPDPASRTTYGLGELAQRDLWFPDVDIPLGAGQNGRGRTPVITMVCGYSRWLSGLLIPSRCAEDLFAGGWELIRRLGAVPKALVWDRDLVPAGADLR